MQTESSIASPTTAISVATRDETVVEHDLVNKARSFALPLLEGWVLDSGENALEHADAVAVILRSMGASDSLLAAVYLELASAQLQNPEELLARQFGSELARLTAEALRLVHLQKQSRDRTAKAIHAQQEGRIAVNDITASHTENVRKLLLAFSKDLRVVMLRLASRLQTLRYAASKKTSPPLAISEETLHVFAPLANRLGIWPLKWELEDLSFRFLEPQTYKDIAQKLDEKRVEREAHMRSLREQILRELKSRGIEAEVSARPKHIYSIVKKMRGKGLDFSRVYDIRAVRIIVANVDACYRVLDHVHQVFNPVLEEFDDYIAKPKPNGYQSLHTVVRDKEGRSIEFQIRSKDMHEHAEHGVAAHWAYKEAGTKGYGGEVTAESSYEAKIAVLRQLLAWERDLSGSTQNLFDDRIYVLTPQAAIVELPKGATPIDFAYSLHTTLGHRCRGAKVDGAMIPLTTPLQNGQTVEIITIKEGGPSRDWLSSDSGYLVTHRAKTKVKAWFNALATQEHLSRGREQVEKLLQREGKTSIKLEDLARDLGLASADELFILVGKDEFSLKAIEAQWKPSEPEANPDDKILAKAASTAQAHRDKPTGRSGVLVVGVDSLLTQLAKCCRPAPPDPILGFVTKGRGVSIHRQDCRDFAHLRKSHPDRVIEVTWSQRSQNESSVYPVDIQLLAHDRQGLLRDISDVLAREKTNVIGVHTASIKDEAHMTFTVQMHDVARLGRLLVSLQEVKGVRSARRK